MTKFKKPSTDEMVSRSFGEYSVDSEGNITGVPIVFEQPTDICGMFEETIARGAISESALKDAAFFYNHDLNTKPLARTRPGKLKFTIESDGVHMIASVNRERSDANDLYIAIQDRDIDGMSFLFRVDADEWTGLDTDYPKRRITKIGYVQEVSAVNYPAYGGTTINARSDSDSNLIALENARARYKKDKSTDVELEKLKAKYLFNL